MNGWANYETWNAALWIGNDEFLYNTAKACVTYREAGIETPWQKFVRCMTDGQIGRHLVKTGDGVRWEGFTRQPMHAAKTPRVVISKYQAIVEFNIYVVMFPWLLLRSDHS